jgi:unsaturated rhamnogalacturonyl hydrolase
MYLETKNEAYLALTNRCVDYIMNEPRLIEDSVNHLGNSPEGKLYPKSIWVDSLMMFSVFPSMYARIEGLPDMTDVAARQPRVMSKYMQDPNTKLWYHSYWVKQNTHYPKRPIFWGRGNGWVVASLPMILDEIGNHPERQGIEAIYKETCAAVLKVQRSDGGFETVLNKPGKTYRELSATALIAAGWFAGIRLGLLDKDTYFEPAQKAYRLVVDQLYEKDGILHMPDISDPTIPLPLFPYLGYKWLPKRSDWSYGLAGLLFAAIEEVRLSGQL